MAEQILRCPYCILNGQPRPMLQRPVWSTCEQCGHIVMPQYAQFKCSCLKCLERREAVLPRFLDTAGRASTS
jgi:hypothetical protein